MVSGDKNKVEWPALFLSADIFNVVLIGEHLPKNRPCSYRRKFKVVLIGGHQYTGGWLLHRDKVRL